MRQDSRQTQLLPIAADSVDGVIDTDQCRKKRSPEITTYKWMIAVAGGVLVLTTTGFILFDNLVCTAGLNKMIQPVSDALTGFNQNLLTTKQNVNTFFLLPIDGNVDVSVGNNNWNVLLNTTLSQLMGSGSTIVVSSQAISLIASLMNVVQQANTVTTSSALNVGCKVMGIGLSSGVAIFLICLSVFIVAIYDYIKQSYCSPSYKH